MHKINWYRFIKDETFRPSEGKEKRANAEIDKRSAFESDFGRVVFSTASRRMHDKTQVIPLTTNDNVHSRLTHSLEVMNIGYSLGISLCRNEKFKELYGETTANELAWQISIILKTAGFVHDIGNPPFGHFGEEIIQEYFKKLFKDTSFDLTEDEKLDYIHFDGNAQGFRILTKLQYLNDLFGLNLTQTTLAAYLKYPNYSHINNKERNDVNSISKYYECIASKKHGVFTSEKVFLDKIIETFELKNTDTLVNFRHPLSFLVEAADSICYLIMDIEDGYGKNWYSYEYIEKELSENEEIKSIFAIIKNRYENKNIDIHTIPKHKLFVDFRVAIIDYFVKLAVKNFMWNSKLIESGNYNYELIEDDPENVAKCLAEFCKRNIFPQREITSLELCGNSVLTGLLDTYIDLVFHKNKKYRKKGQDMISGAILKTAFEEYKIKMDNFTIELDQFDIGDLSCNLKLRIIVDFISGMTDQFAVTHYQLLSGQRI